MIMAQNSTKHTQVITLDVQHTHTHTHIDCTVAGSSIASTAAAVAAASACSGQLTAAATTTQVKPATGGGTQQDEEGRRREAGQAQVQQRETKLRARKMKPIQKQTPEATSALDEY